MMNTNDRKKYFINITVLILRVIITFDYFCIASDDTLEDSDGWGTLVTVTAMRGSTARLPCNINAIDPDDPVLLVLWYKNASVTPVYSFDSRGEISGSGVKQQWGDKEVWGEEEQRAWFDTSTSPAHLMVEDVRGRDEGPYRCKVHFKSSPSWSQKITLNVQDPLGFPRIQDESGKRMEGPVGPFEDGSVVRMTCRSSGEPPPSIEWGGIAVGQGSPAELNKKVSRTKLKITASRATSDAEITCSTYHKNKHKKTIKNTTSVVIRVNLPPLRVRMEAPGDWVVGGQIANFRCRVYGARPKAVIQWWLAGRQLSEKTTMDMSLEGNTTLSTLEFTPADGDDGTPLVCKAFSINLPGTVLQDQIILGVHYIPIANVIVGGEGKAKDISGSVDAQEGRNLLLSCYVKANPPAYNMTWFHNGKPLVQRERSVIIDQGTLRLLNVSAKRHGLYTCVASNDEGDGQSNAINLNVHFSPICAKRQPMEYIINRGGSVTISCDVEAFPPEVSFSWTMKTSDETSQRLPNIGRLEGLKGHYTLQSIKEDHIKVECWAKNIVGQQREPCLFDVITEGKPGIVSNCNVTNHTTSGFLVKCPHKYTVQGKLGVVYNLLVYAQNSAGIKSPTGNEGKESIPLSFGALDRMLRNMTKSTPVFQLTDLSAGQEFAVVIRAFNGEGMSPPSVLSAYTLRDTAQTLKGLPSSPINGGSSLDGSSMSHAVGSITPGTRKNESDAKIGSSFGDSFMPPMMIVLAASLSVIILLSGAIIFGVRRRGQMKRLEKEMEQELKLNDELPYMQTSETSQLSSKELSDTLTDNMKVTLEQHIVLSPDDTSQLQLIPRAESRCEQISSPFRVEKIRDVDCTSNIIRINSPNPVIASTLPRKTGTCNGGLRTATSRESLQLIPKQAEKTVTFSPSKPLQPLLGLKELTSSDLKQERYSFYSGSPQIQTNLRTYQSYHLPLTINNASTERQPTSSVSFHPMLQVKIVPELHATDEQATEETREINSQENISVL